MSWSSSSEKDGVAFEDGEVDLRFDLDLGTFLIEWPLVAAGEEVSTVGRVSEAAAVLARSNRSMIRSVTASYIRVKR